MIISSTEGLTHGSTKLVEVECDIKRGKTCKKKYKSIYNTVLTNMRNNNNKICCKSCSIVLINEKRFANHIYKTEEEKKESWIQYYKKNKNSQQAYKKKYRAKNKDRIKEKEKEYYTANKKKVLDRNRLYYEGVKDTINAKRREYRKNNLEDVRNKERETKKGVKKRRWKTDIQYRLKETLRARLYLAIKGNHKSGSAVRDLGCSIDEFKIHIENQFTEGMTWDNHGLYGWHLDHIISLSSFDLENREQFLEACHYTNMQPLWAKDNLSKGNKI